MKSKITLSLLSLSLIVIACLTFYSLNSDAPIADVTSVASIVSSAESDLNNNTSSAKYDDIIGFIEENDYYNAYNEFQKLTEEQRKSEHNSSEVLKNQKEEKKQKEENQKAKYAQRVKKIDINTKNLLDYYEIFQKEIVKTHENGTKYAYIQNYIQLKPQYKIAKLSMGYATHIYAGIALTERARYYTIDSKTEKVILDDYLPPSTTFFSHRSTRGVTFSNNGEFFTGDEDVINADDIGQYLITYEDLVFFDVKGTLYIELT
ncbi:MAG: hypothetical protein E7551_08135 [Ruminococcaceae bacterium]|nr:hypothetical protein [Oscillospiraceae bacterium]